MVLLVCGDREWAYYACMLRAIRRLSPDLIKHGACRGADLMSEEIAKRLEIPYMGIPAKWSKQGKAAGAIRNPLLLLDPRPDFVAAFHNNIAASKGTKHMLELTKKAGIPWELFTYQNANPSGEDA